MVKKPVLSAEEKALFKKAMADITPNPKTKIKSDLKEPENQESFSYRRYQASKTTSQNYVSASLDPDDRLYFQGPNVDDKSMQKLSQGLFASPPILDLHGLSETLALNRVSDFIYAAHKQGIKVVLIIHGKGKRELLNAPILKNALNNALPNLSPVRAFCSARKSDGGTGAVYVLLHSSHYTP